MIGRLPTELVVNNVKYPIRTDFRNVLDVFVAFNDNELEKAEKWFVALYMIFEDFTCIEDLEDAIDQGFDAKEAIGQVAWFINGGKEPTEKETKKPVFDWEQDEQLIFSAINHVAVQEVRLAEYIHWWTFLAYFNEVGEGMFSYVVGLRRKLNEGKQLDKAEQKFYRENKELVELKRRYTKEEQELMDYVSEIL